MADTDTPAPRYRRLVIRDPNGSNMVVGGLLIRIDLTGLPNANSTCPLSAVVQEQCDLDHWHDLSQHELPCWGPD